MATILLIEDNETIKKGLEYLFYENDLLLLWASTLKKAQELIKEKTFDLILLDVMLPDGDGFEFFKEHQEEINVPVIFLTAKDLENDIVRGLEMGAVDYIIKPFYNRELILRINKALALKKNNKIKKIKDLTIDLDKMQVYKNKKLIELTSLEFKILNLFLNNLNRVITRETILNNIWDEFDNFVNDNTLTVYIKRLREKLGNDLIKTIKGIGYMMEDD